MKWNRARSSIVRCLLFSSLFGLPCFAVVGCPAGDTTSGGNNNSNVDGGAENDNGSLDDEQRLPNIYVAVVMHNEEPYLSMDGELVPGQYPDFTEDPDAFQFQRSMVVRFANMLFEEGVKFNYQSDWNFLLATMQYDDGTNTNGKNLLRYLKEDLDFAVDPHAHETTYNYADVAYLESQLLGDEPSGVVGGMIYYPYEDSKLEYLLEPIDGWHYNYTWSAEILWGAGTFLHQGNDEKVSGVWRPKSTEEFFVDDPGNLPYVGGYINNAGGVLDLLDRANGGSGSPPQRPPFLPPQGRLAAQVPEGTDELLDPDRIYTVTMNFTQRTLQSEEDIEEARRDIQSIKVADVNGLVHWATLEEIVSVWQIEYDSEPAVRYAPGFVPNAAETTPNGGAGLDLRVDSE